MTPAHGIALGLALVLNAAANLLIKFGMKKLSEAGPLLQGGVMATVVKVITSPELVFGMICFAANLLFYSFALQKMKISVAYPIMVTVGFAIIVTIAGWKLGERLSSVQWVGIVLIMAGVILVASRAGEQLGG